MLDKPSAQWGGLAGSAQTFPFVVSVERLGVALALAETCTAQGDFASASAVIASAEREFAFLPGSAPCLALAGASLALRSGDPDAALAALKGFPPASELYPSALRLRADIYLRYLRDRDAYVACFEELCARQPRSESALLALGDAFMIVQRPDEAVSVFERALQLSVERVSSALYVRAIVYVFLYFR